MINLAPQDLRIVCNIMRRHVPDYEVRVFGSRVTGTAKKFSDLDLVIMSNKPVARSIMRKIADDLDESDLPILVDVLDWQRISPSFQAIIEKRYEILHLN